MGAEEGSREAGLRWGPQRLGVSSRSAGRRTGEREAQRRQEHGGTGAHLAHS